METVIPAASATAVPRPDDNAASATAVPRPDDNPFRDPNEVPAVFDDSPAAATNREARRGNEAHGDVGKTLRKAAAKGDAHQAQQFLRAARGAGATLVHAKDGSGRPAIGYGPG